MAWVQLIKWLQSQDTLTLIIALGILIFLIYKGIIRIPSINKTIRRKKCENPHISCINYIDLGNRLSKLMVLKTEIDRIINLDILREQMNLVDQIVYDIRKKMELHFDKILKNQQPDIQDVNSSIEHKIFENIAKLGEKTIRDLFRFIMKENRIPNNEAEFILYAKNRANNVINRVIEELSVNWHRGLSITKEIYMKAYYGKIQDFRDLNSEIEEQIITTLKRCRDINNRKWLEIMQYDDEAAALFPEIYEEAMKKEGEKRQT